MFGKKTKSSRTRTASRRRVQSPRRNSRRKPSMTKNVILGSAIMLVPAVLLGLGGQMVIEESEKVSMENTSNYCFPGIQYEPVPFFIDYSTTNLFASERHLRSLKTKFVDYVKVLKPNQRLDVFTTAKETVTDVAKPVFSSCMPASTPDQHDLLIAENPNIKPMLQARLNHFREEATARVRAKVDWLIADSQSRKMNVEEYWSAPLMEQFRSLSRYYSSNTVQDMVIFSGGIQVSQDLYFCKYAGNLPKFANFKRNNPLYEKMKLHDGFQGTNVTFLMPRVLDRYYIGDHCTSDEIHSWWQDSFNDGGASDVYIQPLHYEVSSNNIGTGGFPIDNIAAASLLLGAAWWKGRA